MLLALFLCLAGSVVFLALCSPAVLSGGPGRGQRRSPRPTAALVKMFLEEIGEE